MNSMDYDKLWNNCIRPSLEIICKSDTKLRIRDGSYETICRLYNDVRNKAKRQYMVGELDSKLDRHKIASCMAKAIIMSQPLIKDIDADYSGDEDAFIIANEALAFAVGLSILKAFLELKIQKAEKLSEDEYEAYQEICRHDFVFPQSIMGEYPAVVCWGWHHDYLDGYFDILGTANLFFMIENYSILYYKTQNK